MTERTQAIEQELVGVETLPELKAIWCHWNAEAPECVSDPLYVLMIKSTLTRLRYFPKVGTDMPAEEVAKVVKQPMQSTPRPQVSRKYKLLKLNVEWTTVPQVHAIMSILSAHIKVGDVVDESDIIRMMEANELVLQTKQGGKRIWDYYKGNNDRGLQAHGNVERM